MLVFGWANRGSTLGFVKHGLSASREPFSLFRRGVLICSAAAMWQQVA